MFIEEHIAQRGIHRQASWAFFSRALCERLPIKKSPKNDSASRRRDGTH
jgi:hypothetical protein